MTTKDGFKSCWMSYYKKGNEHFILYDDGYNQTCTYSLYKVNGRMFCDFFIII